LRRAIRSVRSGGAGKTGQSEKKEQVLHRVLRLQKAAVEPRPSKPNHLLQDNLIFFFSFRQLQGGD
jgi:hypothetical protein